jgi:uncharacterized protein (TIGR00251 family)
MVKTERLVRVRVIPNSDRSSIQRREDEIKVKLTVPAEKGKANKRLLKILYRTFGTRDIVIVGGERSRSKLIRIRAEEGAVDRIISTLPVERS